MNFRNSNALMFVNKNLWELKPPFLDPPIRIASFFSAVYRSLRFFLVILKPLLPRQRRLPW